MAVPHTIRLGTRGQPEESRAAILNAAVGEFAREGVAGARTDAIARSAGVNKALLYYYFKDKESLYDAVLEDVFSGARAAVHAALSLPLPPRKKLAAYVGAHFDYIASNAPYHRLVQAEFLRATRDASRVQHLATQFFQPIFSELSALLRAGEQSGDFRSVDAVQFIPSMIAVIAFYFTTAPVIQVMTGCDPLSPERLVQRRAAAIDFISAALFTRNKTARNKLKLNKLMLNKVTQNKGERK